jgi:hypothetical protein
MDDGKHVDESWKDSVMKEKEGAAADSPHDCDEGCECGQDQTEIEVSFLNYIMSLGYQAMIFLGEVPHPMTGKNEKNIRQAKFLIDTLQLLKNKTKGNLSTQEEQLLSSSLYELQMKYVEVSGKDKVL